MNERMEAVGRKVGLVVIGDGVFGQRWYSSKCGLDVTEYEQLVTEIVRECIMTVELSSECFTADQVFIKKLAVDKLKTHFGVE